MPRSLIQEPLDYKTTRSLQISVVFTFTIFIQQLFHYPRAGWTGFALMMIYAGFDNGTTLFRAYQRFLGVLLGLLSGYFLWFLGHLDYRTLIFLIPLTVFLAYFLVGQSYSVPTVFTVNTSIIGTGYFNPSGGFTITTFLIDYFMCTIIAFTIILIFEHFWFRRYQMMGRFIRDTQLDLVKHLYQLVQLLEQKNIRSSEWFEHCIILTRYLAMVNNLAQNAQFEKGSELAVGENFNQFIAIVHETFIKQKALYFAHSTVRHLKYDYNHLLQEIITNLDLLQTLVVKPEIPTKDSHATAY